MRQQIFNALIGLSIGAVVAALFLFILLIWGIVDDPRTILTALIVAFGLSVASMGFA